MEKYNSILSKSNYLNGLRCSKLLWVSVYDEKRISKLEEIQKKATYEEKIFGKLAKKLFPKGIDIFEETLFIEGVPFRNNILESDPDSLNILEPSKGGFNLICVKSSTKIEKEHIHEISFQRYKCEKSGLDLDRCYITFLNKDYVKGGKINPKKLFKKEDVTDRVKQEEESVIKNINSMLEIICSEEPRVEISSSCNDPYKCPLKDSCWSFLPENSVFDLYRGDNKSWDLFKRGILKIVDIPEDEDLTKNQRMQKECIINQRPHIEERKIEKFISSLEYPLYFLDFETYQSAIPINRGATPYQQIPFQFSVIEIDTFDKKKQYSFIASSSKDPRKSLIDSLKKNIGKRGSILVWNESLEKTVLGELGETFPIEERLSKRVISRVRDLMTPFKKFNYYHPSQKGSLSIEKLLPALVGLSYEGMEISDEACAATKYFNLICEKGKKSKIKKEEIKKIRKELKDYRDLNVEGMFLIFKKLERV